MRKLKFLLVAVGVHCQTASLECLKLESGGSFGSYQYKLNSYADTCLNLLQINTEIDCTIESQDQSTETFTCDYVPADNNALACPKGPQGCTYDQVQPDGDQNDYSCSYTCVHQDLQCPEETDETKYYPVINTDDTIACFEDEISKWQISVPDVDNTNQIEFTCTEKDCEFLDPDDTGLFTLELDRSNPTKQVLTSTFEYGTSPNNIFECNSNDKNAAGCDCIYDPSDNTLTTTTITCEASAFVSECDGLNSCTDKICYYGQPMMDRNNIDCSAKDKDINFCTRTRGVFFPCGDNFYHNCEPTGNTYKCTCKNVPENTCKTVLEGSFSQGVNTDPDTCTITDIKTEDEIVDCDRQCYDESFANQDCTNPVTNKYWQCFDDFTIIQIVPATSTTNFQAKKVDATYDDLSMCSTLSCPNGYCECVDKKSEKAEEYCSSYTGYFVSEKEGTSAPIPDTKTDEYEFRCLSFMADYAAINNVDSDLDKVSECQELVTPLEGENAVCPTFGGCHTMPGAGTGVPQHGFDDCMCEKMCSYKCADSNYEAVFQKDVFPDDWNFEKDGNIFTPYTCAKKEDEKNLVMIICTSIFVPLGVAGIAAGVYFFFFHESSEVAPVETDNELASTRATEHNKFDEDKEETHSEIAKDN